MPGPPRALFAALVDDAALFPPGNAPMGRAVADHLARNAAPDGDLVGPFLCPASRIDELTSVLSADQRMSVALVNDVTGVAALHARTVTLRMSSLAWIESRHDLLGDDREAVSGGRRGAGPMAYLEVPRTRYDEVLDLISEQGPWHAAKYRTGGVTADAYPDEVELAAFLVACVRRGLPFKLTAGLHRAVRNTTGEGFEQHGVLNVLVATRLAQSGDGDVTKALAERDGAVLADEVRGWGDAEAAAVRRSFRSFGCCGVQDPIGDLAGLGLVQPA